MEKPECRLKQLICRASINARYNLRKYRSLVVPRTINPSGSRNYSSSPVATLTMRHRAANFYITS